MPLSARASARSAPVGAAPYVSSIGAQRQALPGKHPRRPRDRTEQAASTWRRLDRISPGRAGREREDVAADDEQRSGLEERMRDVLDIPLHRFLGLRLAVPAAGVLLEATSPSLNQADLLHGGIASPCSTSRRTWPSRPHSRGGARRDA